ncbi:MAG: hypothetical protein PHQ60_02340 [Sideroxydans sp.]|nr:hypothetical protein [Sideroxydans sp.]MDD5056683.1 hypothetical protein [Sideroxydans sp.]
MAAIDAIPEKDAKFVRSLETKSTQFDRDGRMGGELANLTDKQVAYLDGLYQKYGNCI